MEKSLTWRFAFFFPSLFYHSVYLSFLFPEIVSVVAVKLSMYKKDRNRGLAFVEMGSPEEALEALNKLESYVRLKHSTLLLLFTHTFWSEVMFDFSFSFYEWWVLRSLRVV